MNIETYKEDLKGCCDACKKASKCKNKEQLCVFKKYVFFIGKRVYKSRVKKGLIKEDV